MKTKAFLFLAAGLCLFLVGGFVTIQMVTAQIHTKMPWPPTSVVFEEDPYREHGLQINSVYGSSVPPETYTVVYTAPANENFVITDVVSLYECNVYLKRYVESPLLDEFLITTPLKQWNGQKVSLNSGLVLEAGQKLKVWQNAAEGNNDITVSGYLVEL